MTKRFGLIFAALGALQAQQVVTPTPEQVGPPRGENAGNYNVTQSFETGYRFNSVTGDVGEYRSDVNYGNGLRLLGSSLTVNSKEGHGRFFDEIVLNTTGLGNDPYESAILRIQKNRLYRYDMSWRLENYYNPGLTVAGGAHLMNTGRRIQDHELTLLPQSKFRFHVGYSRNAEDGPALSTALEFDANGTGYPVFTDVKRKWDEYRVGAEGEFSGFKFTVMHRWDFYKDDSPYSSAGVVASGNPDDQTVLQTFTRPAPLHGRSPAWLGNLYKKSREWSVNARITYVRGVGDFALDELASGIGQFGTPAARQIAVQGEAERPDVVGDLNISFYPTDRFTISNNTTVVSQRMNGDSIYSEVLTGLNLGTSLNFRYLGIRTVANSLDLDYRLTNWLGVYGRYDYSDRLVKTIEGLGDASNAASFSSDTYDVTNILQAGTAGIRVRPLKALTVNFEGEVDRASHPLTPISPNHYQLLNGRATYRLKTIQLSAVYHEAYNASPQFGFLLTSSHARSYNANASWMPKSWLTLDVSYAKLHLDSLSFLAFFAGVNRPQLQTGRSLYISNIHSGNLGARFAMGRRADLYVGYSITKDTGDGRATAVPAGITDPVQSLLASVQTFPLSYQSPLARFSFRISPKVRWNAGYQFYNYSELFHVFGYDQNFHASTGFTSVLWSF